MGQPGDTFGEAADGQPRPSSQRIATATTSTLTITPTVARLSAAGAAARACAQLVVSVSPQEARVRPPGLAGLRARAGGRRNSPSGG